MPKEHLYAVITAGNAEEARLTAAHIFERDLEISEAQAKSLAVLAVKYCWYHRKPLSFGYGLVYSVISHFQGDYEPEGRFSRERVEEYRAKHEHSAEDVEYLAIGNYDVASGSFPAPKRRRKAAKDSRESL